ncbi:hypothetical protein SH501x_003200 [Pirellulaceae bacterium SH501]
MKLPRGLPAKLQQVDETNSLSKALDYVLDDVYVNREIVFQENQRLSSRQMNELAARVYLAEERAKECKFDWRSRVVVLQHASNDRFLTVVRPLWRVQIEGEAADAFVTNLVKSSIYANGFALKTEDDKFIVHSDGHRFLLNTDETTSEITVHFEDNWFEFRDTKELKIKTTGWREEARGEVALRLLGARIPKTGKPDYWAAFVNSASLKKAMPIVFVSFGVSSACAMFSQNWEYLIFTLIAAHVSAFIRALLSPSYVSANGFWLNVQAGGEMICLPLEPLLVEMNIEHAIIQQNDLVGRLRIANLLTKQVQRLSFGPWFPFVVCSWSVLLVWIATQFWKGTP